MDITTITIIIVIILVLAGIIQVASKHQLERLYLDSSNTPMDFNCSISLDKSQQGSDYFKTKKIIITGLVRDSTNNIPIMKKNFEKITKLFKDYRILIVENDSKDNTREQLLEMVNKDPKITILGCGVNVDKCSLKLPATIVHGHDAKRIHKMVLLRNIYIDYISDHSEEYKDFDFVIVWDLDIRGTIYYDGIGLAGYYFKHNPLIECQCANGIKINNFLNFTLARKFDPFAHREEGDDEKKMTRKEEILWSLDLEKCKEDQVRKVVTCFNGFSIYRKDALAHKSYDLIEKNGEALCEHHALNRQLQGVYMNPYMIFSILKNQ